MINNELDKELSLVSIMKSDPSFSDRIKEVSKKIEKDKKTVLNMAAKYSQKYEREIAEGTEQEKLLLTEGANHGLSHQETMTRYGRFLPTVRTPILNWLYFFMEEQKYTKDERHTTEGAKYSRLTSVNLMLKKIGEELLEWEDFRNVSWKAIDEITDKVRSAHNIHFGNFEHSDLNSSGELKSDNAPEMMTYLYGNLTLDTFNKLKKLKALTKSPNENEAFRAYRACLKLCDKYNLEFDRIPN